MGCGASSISIRTASTPRKYYAKKATEAKCSGHAGRSMTEEGPTKLYTKEDHSSVSTASKKPGLIELDAPRKIAWDIKGNETHNQEAGKRSIQAPASAESGLRDDQLIQLSARAKATADLPLAMPELRQYLPPGANVVDITHVEVGPDYDKTERLSTPERRVASASLREMAVPGIPALSPSSPMETISPTQSQSHDFNLSSSSGHVRAVPPAAMIAQIVNRAMESDSMDEETRPGGHMAELGMAHGASMDTAGAGWAPPGLGIMAPGGVHLGRAGRHGNHSSSVSSSATSGNTGGSVLASLAGSIETPSSSGGGVDASGPGSGGSLMIMAKAGMAEGSQVSVIPASAAGSMESVVRRREEALEG